MTRGSGTHQRNTGPMQAAPRCGARTRSGAPCAAPAIAGAARCRMHGGKGSGAPQGNHNALKSGLYTRPMLERCARTRSLLRAARQVLREIERDIRR